MGKKRKLVGKGVPVAREDLYSNDSLTPKYPIPHAGLAYAVYGLTNGYLLHVNSPHNANETVYCKDLNEVHEQMVAHKAKQKVDSRYGVNPAYVSGQYDPQTQAYIVTIPSSLALSHGETVTIKF
jgi:hypothetical protein